MKSRVLLFSLLSSEKDIFQVNGYTFRNPFTKNVKKKFGLFKFKKLIFNKVLVKYLKGNGVQFVYIRQNRE